MHHGDFVAQLCERTQGTKRGALASVGALGTRKQNAYGGDQGYALQSEAADLLA